MSEKKPFSYYPRIKLFHLDKISAVSDGFALRFKLDKFILFSILSFLWLPLAFLNFDSHHDGLILSTIRLTKQSLLNSGEYPFNQYGPFWAIPFLVLSFIVSDDFLFLAMRLLTICLYLLSALILFKSSKFFLKVSAWIPPALFLASQPFVSDIGSNLVPWPSAIAMPLILLVFHNAMKCLSVEQKARHFFLLGFVVPLIIFTRIQIGILALAGVAVVLLYCRRGKLFMWSLFGLTCSSVLMVSALFRLNWFSSAAYDQLVFGLTYLSADKSTFPKPIFTFVGVLIVVSTLFCIPFFRTTTNSALKNGRFLFFLSIGVLLAVFYVASSRDLNFLSTQVVITRRVWIVITLGAVSFFLIKIGLGAINKTLSFGNFLKIHRDSIVLAMFAIVMQSQAYPLFDQMHFWWGSPISFLVLTIIAQRTIREFEISQRFRRFSTLLLFVLISFSLVFPWLSQITKEKVEYPSAIGLKIFSVESAVREQELLQNFFTQNLPKNSSILNVCDDTNVFFSASNYIPSSRFFVLWAEQMSHAVGILDDMKNSTPDFIVSCDLTHAPELRASQEKTRDLIVESFGKSVSSVASFVSTENKNWFIYKIN